MTRVSIPDPDHLARAPWHRRFPYLRRHGEVDEGNATRPCVANIWANSVSSPRLRLPEMAIAWPPKVSCLAPAEAQNEAIASYTSGYPLFLLSRHVRASRSQFKMTSELRNPGAPSTASARRPRWLPASESGSDHSSDQPRRANDARYNRYFRRRLTPLSPFYTYTF